MRTIDALRDYNFRNYFESAWDIGKKTVHLVQAAVDDSLTVGTVAAGVYLGYKKIAPVIVRNGAAILGAAANNFSRNIQRIAKVAGGVIASQAFNYALDAVGAAVLRDEEMCYLTNESTPYEWIASFLKGYHEKQPTAYEWVTPLLLGIKISNMYEALNQSNVQGSEREGNVQNAEGARKARIISLIAGGALALAGCLGPETIRQNIGLVLGSAVTFTISSNS